MADKSDLEEILRSLVDIDTSNPPGRNYGQITDVIKKHLASADCKVEVVRTPEEKVREVTKNLEVVGERVNLVATLTRGEGKTVILNAHVDVVPTGIGWTKPPFEITRKGDEWYGRGVSDDKGPLAAFINILINLAKSSHWRGKVVLAATVDEEIGGFTGLGYLLESGIVCGDYCIVGDGDIGYITYASNGCLRFRVTVKGKSVHSSKN